MGNIYIKRWPFGLCQSTIIVLKGSSIIYNYAFEYNVLLMTQLNNENALVPFASSQLSSTFPCTKTIGHLAFVLKVQLYLMILTILFQNIRTNTFVKCFLDKYNNATLQLLIL